MLGRDSSRLSGTGLAEIVAFLYGLTRRSKRVVNKKILLGYLSKVNCMHMLARLS